MLRPLLLAVMAVTVATPALAQRSPRRAPAVDPVPTAQAIFTATGVDCQITEAVLLGQTPERDNLLEAACATGPGYLLQTSTPPQTFDCVVLAATADKRRAAGQEVPAGTTCTLPANQNIMGVIASYAQQAGVPCAIDAGKVVGANASGAPVYEVGCSGSDGYRIERSANGWSKIDCLQVMSSNSTCAFTTPEEQVAGFKPLLVGTDIDDCDAQQIRLMGQNDNGRFIEVKCASGEGFVTRVKDNAVAQVYACAVAQRIGGGCTLTPVAAATSEQH